MSYETSDKNPIRLRKDARRKVEEIRSLMAQLQLIKEDVSLSSVVNKILEELPAIPIAYGIKHPEMFQYNYQNWMIVNLFTTTKEMMDAFKALNEEIWRTLNEGRRLTEELRSKRLEGVSE